MAASKKAGQEKDPKKTVKLDRDFHKQVKAAALDRDVPMEALVEEALRSYLGLKRRG